MKAFHSDPKIKEKYLERVRKHREADNLIRGDGWDGHRGCAVGCTLGAYDHGLYPIELGIPEWLARVEDTLFEGMPEKAAMDWPTQFLQAIPVGVDLEQIKAPFMIFILESTLGNFDHEKFPDVKKAVEGVIALHKSGDIANEEKRSAAWSAAWSAESAAWSAAEPAAFQKYANNLRIEGG